MEVGLDGLKRSFPASAVSRNNKTKPTWEKNLNNKNSYFQRNKLCSSYFIHTLLLHPFPEYLPILNTVKTWCISISWMQLGVLPKYLAGVLQYLSSILQHQLWVRWMWENFNLHLFKTHIGKLSQSLEGGQCLKQKPSIPEKQKSEGI